ncbi:MAG TPA: hypothetical protein VMN82_09835, partial [Thermoanaerobaculia bacterium]|nr:hypothetical protein [Thermoanaerobaculia bacterium]
MNARERHFTLEVEPGHRAVFDLAFSMRRQIFVGRRGEARSLSPSAFVDALALGCLHEFNGATFQGDDGVRKLDHVQLSLSDEQRRSFAEAFLAYNEHLTSKAESHDEGVVDGEHRVALSFVPRTDIEWKTEPIERLHQAWCLHEEDSAAQWARLQAPYESLKALALPKWQRDTTLGFGGVVADMQRRTETMERMFGSISPLGATDKLNRMEKMLGFSPFGATD